MKDNGRMRKVSNGLGSDVLEGGYGMDLQRGRSEMCERDEQAGTS